MGEAHLHTVWENSKSKLTAVVWIQEIFTHLLVFTSRIISLQSQFLPLLQEYHPKIEIISEVTNDSDSVLEEDSKSMFENSAAEVPTAIFSNVCKIHKDQEKERLRPLVESFFTEPANPERYLETKGKQATSSKPLIQEIITEPEDHLLVSPVCNRPEDASPWKEEGKITVTQLITERKVVVPTH